METTILVKVSNPSTLERPVFGFKLGKAYYRTIERREFVTPLSVLPFPGAVLVAVVRTDTYATTGYSKFGYAADAVKRHIAEWEAKGVDVYVRRREQHSWTSRDWYQRSYGDSSYAEYVYIRPHGPFEMLAGESRYNIDCLISDNYLKELSTKCHG